VINTRSSVFFPYSRHLCHLLLALIISLFNLSACRSQDSHQRELYVFGTLNQIQIVGLNTQQASDLFGQINQGFQAFHRDWHAWKPGELDQLNKQIALGKSFKVKPELSQLIRDAQILETTSSGSFNPAIGQLIHAWGFHSDDYPITSPPPSPGEIARLVKHQPSSLQLQIGAQHQISSSNPHVWLDFGGLAKGAAVDWAIQQIKNTGATGGIVNAGGDLRAFGLAHKRPWRVAIRHPVKNSILAMLEIEQDESVFTSGNYARYKEFEGQRYAHIIDPRNGQPVSEIISATVVTEQGTKADAAATAFIVSGLEHAPQLAKDMSVNQVLLIDQAQCVWISIGLYQRLEFTDPRPSCIKQLR